jgi:predicted dehydrogenase
MTDDEAEQDYGLSKVGESVEIAAPDLPYRPRHPETYTPPIGLIACGGITEYHLTAYRNAGFHVVALCDVDRPKAEAHRKKYYPEADVYDDYREVVAREDIEVLDIATHPPERVEIVQAALESGKHVLSQKPFVEDLDVGQRLVDLAARKERKLAVNQNGRWAPHFGYIAQAIRAGLIGEVTTVDFALHWDHNWTADTPFNEIHHLILYDFAIHWFDIATLFFGDRKAKKVYAAVERSAGQRAKPPFLAHAAVEFEQGQATYVFNADCPLGQEDRTTVVGTKGTIRSVGPSLTDQKVTLYTEKGHCSPALEGSWFPDGFHGTMGELLCAIEEDREPSHAAAGNLRSLALCFAAAQSADTGSPVEVGSVRSI